jgi:hypothetical protein
MIRRLLLRAGAYVNEWVVEPPSPAPASPAPPTGADCVSTRSMGQKETRIATWALDIMVQDIFRCK